MKKGISFFFGYSNDIRDRAKQIKNFGFDCVMTNQDPRFNDDNGTINKQIELFKINNLEVSTLHNQYKTEELEFLWTDTEIGDRLEETLKQDILTASKYGFKSVVVHTMGNYNKIGEARLLRLLELCEKSNVFLAIENIDYKQPFADIFENISHPYLKFCYDSGHNNCFDPEFDYLEKYGDKLICFHLHDNNGKQDQHTLNKFGTINWKNLAKKLSKLNLENISLDYELLLYCEERSSVSLEECLSETYRQACELEEMILKYKKDNL